MKQNLSSFAAGFVFSLGLVVSQMTNPEKVISFLDFSGGLSGWDPSPGFVMGSAMLVTFTGYHYLQRRTRPVFAEKFQMPTNQKIDRRLILGAVMFGFGWGLVGLCPGPAIAAVSFGGTDILVFVATMLAGFASFEFVSQSGNDR